ncbi:MAG: hypothetical protein M3173_05570 [Chloroflexota bacterium]|nr:hypothetical protein [Chloroflexota bacterium]
MTDRDDIRREQEDSRPQTIVVPGSSHDYEELGDEDRIDEAQRAKDLGSASRSCVAIIAVLLIVALLLCVFLIWGAVLR